MEVRIRLAALAACAITVIALPLAAADAPQRSAAAPQTAPAPDAPLPWDAAPQTAPPADVLRAADAVPAEGAEVTMLLDEERYVFTADGQATSSHHLVYRINAESAIDSWASVEAFWAPWYQDKPEIQARVITKDGTERQYDPKALSESAAPEESLDIFSDNRILRGPLPAIAPGSIVEETITSVNRNPLPGAGTSDRFFFGRSIPVRQSRLVLDAPAALTLRIVNRTNPELQPKKSIDGERQKIVFESGPLAAIEHVEWNLPSDTTTRGFVGFSTGSSWQDMATHYSSIVDTQIGDGSAVDELVREAKAKAKDRQALASALLEAVEKRIRYAGVELGVASVIPRPPSEVLSHSYGDCKDKATLLTAMLRKAGIPASVALLRAGQDLDVNPDLPGMGQFNHAIVYVEGKEPFWIDPTDEFSRAGELPLLDQGRLALIASPKTTALVRTPVQPSTANRTVEQRVFTLSEEGKASVTEISESRGGTESLQRRYYASSDKKKFRDGLEDYAKSNYLAKELKDFQATDPHDLATPFRVTLVMSEAGRGSTDDGEAAVGILPAALIEQIPYALREPDDDEEGAAKSPHGTRHKRIPRVHDFVFPMPHLSEWQYRIVPPPGYAPRPLPSSETLKLGTTTFTTKWASTPDGVVTANIVFDTGKQRLTPAEFEETRKALREFAQKPAVLVGFDQKGQLLLSQGDVGGALTEYRKLAALHPSEARHHTEVARALLVGGMGSEARAEIERAIATEPGYAPAWQTKGIILQSDLLGRPFRKGFDLDGALAAYRKAKELDPKNLQIRAEYAKLLEYGSDGLPFGRGAKLTEAIAEYKAIGEELKDDRVEGELLLALANARKFADLKELATKSKDAERRVLGRVIAVAALEGSDAALREASSLDQSDRRKTLEAASATLTALRLYPQAADLLDSATQGTPRATEMRGHIEMLRKTKSVDLLSLPPNDPKTVVQKLLIDEMLNDTDARLETQFFTADARKQLDRMNADPDAKARQSTSLRLVAMRQELPITFYADAAMAGLQLLQDGDENSGYHIVVRSAPGSGGEVSEVFFVVREGKEYRIAASNHYPGLIGWNVLRLVREGKSDVARQWLNWTRDAINSGGGDDPLTGPPFARIWAKNKAAATDDEIRTAAASIMYGKIFVDEALPLLEHGRTVAKGDEVRSRIDLAIAEGCAAKEDWACMEKASLRLVDSLPDSSIAFDMLTAAQTELGKRAEVERLANERLKANPRDRDALRALARAALHSGDYDQADADYRKVVEQQDPQANDYNNVAWNALFTQKNITRAVDEARQAVSMDNGNSASMHTLAALYAEIGRSGEARDLLLKSMDEAGRDDPAPHDWYVLGRIAENYGAKESALAAYKRVDEEKKTPESTWVLAQRRLKVLDATPAH